ncbi:hypothetical protein J8F10_17055 [Gemmata sp. G18]|uniref:Uncharacterized protein n=1 Tax=Gemmata palustris TaxID=2822762 RepID=A0ABS5BTC4_9BACT|nr:hypothetical protein [Gemmata palustris]
MISGTRISVELVLEGLGCGPSVDDLLRGVPAPHARTNSRSRFVRSPLVLILQSVIRSFA